MSVEPTRYAVTGLEATRGRPPKYPARGPVFEAELRREIEELSSEQRQEADDTT